MNLSFSSTSLVTAFTLSGYLAYRCAQNPNPNPTNAKVTDRIGILTELASASRYLLASIWLYHIILILFPENRANICLHPELLNENLFTWSRGSVIFLIVIFIAAPIRLLAYKNLGKNFTFRLEKPKNLVKDGLYAYVQHPSYTTIFLVQVGCLCFWGRFDGVSACFLPASFVGIRWNSEIAGVVIAVGTAWILWERVKDEEAMLKREFGKEWIEYHSRTSRFLPGFF